MSPIKHVSCRRSLSTAQVDQPLTSCPNTSMRHAVRQCRHCASHVNRLYGRYTARLLSCQQDSPSCPAAVMSTRQSFLPGRYAAWDNGWLAADQPHLKL